jgi:hypothetical protein
VEPFRRDHSVLLAPVQRPTDLNLLIPTRAGNFARPNERAGKGVARTVGTYGSGTHDRYLHARNQLRRTEVCRRTGEYADPMSADFARKLMNEPRKLYMGIFD